MSNLISWEYFRDVYLGEGVREEDFPRLESRAEDLLNDITRGAIDNSQNLHAKDLELLKKALCAQVEYYSVYSLDVGFKAGDDSFTVGKVSVSAGNSESEREKTFVSPSAVRYLESAGLMSRVVGVC